MLSIIGLNSRAQTKLHPHAGKIAIVSALIMAVFIYNITNGPGSFFPETSLGKSIMGLAALSFAWDAVAYFLIYNKKKSLKNRARALGMSQLKKYIKTISVPPAQVNLVGLPFKVFVIAETKTQKKKDVFTFCSSLDLQNKKAVIFQETNSCAIIRRIDLKSASKIQYAIYFLEQESPIDPQKLADLQKKSWQEILGVRSTV